MLSRSRARSLSFSFGVYVWIYDILHSQTLIHSHVHRAHQEKSRAERVMCRLRWNCALNTPITSYICLCCCLLVPVTTWKAEKKIMHLKNKYICECGHTFYLDDIPENLCFEHVNLSILMFSYVQFQNFIQPHLDGVQKNHTNWIQV